MTEYIDLKLTKGDKEYYDINFGSGGDFEKVEGLETSILMSFYGEKRAGEGEVVRPELRRGWLGNKINAQAITDDLDYEIGSKLWLLYQARLLTETLNLAIDYVKNGFQWYIDDNIAKNIEVSGEIEQNNIRIDIVLIRNDDTIDNESFLLWNKTKIYDIGE